MPHHARVSTNTSESQSSGRGRQRLKLAAIGYVNARHGVDTDADLVRGALKILGQMAIEFVGTLSGEHLKNRRLDAPGNPEMLKLAAIAYVSARHGIDADIGMSREGLAMLCQASIGFVESLPRDDASAKRPASSPRQIVNGAQP